MRWTDGGQVRDQPRAGLRRIREWFAARMWGRCPMGGAHRWLVASDYGYGQDLWCAKCKEDGYMDYGR